MTQRRTGPTTYWQMPDKGVWSLGRDGLGAPWLVCTVALAHGSQKGNVLASLTPRAKKYKGLPELHPAGQSAPEQIIAPPTSRNAGLHMPALHEGSERGGITAEDYIRLHNRWNDLRDLDEIFQRGKKKPPRVRESDHAGVEQEYDTRVHKQVQHTPTSFRHRRVEVHVSNPLPPSPSHTFTKNWRRTQWSVN